MNLRYAILSDIHGNQPALLKVIEDAGKRGIDHFIIAGDYCISGAWPDECIATIMDLPGKVVIRGNEERYLENLIGKDQAAWTDGQMQISYWSYRNIRPDHLEYLLSLPQTAEFAYGKTKVHVTHSSDQFLGEYEFPQFGPAVLAGRYADCVVTKERLSRDLQELLDQDPVFAAKVNTLEDGVYIFGHSHVQWSYKVSGRNVLLVNPGSCGLPLDAIEESIPYSILTISEDGETGIEEIRIPFSKRDYVKKLRQTSQYEQAAVWSKVITFELLTAREHMTFFLRFAEQYANQKGDDRRPFSMETWEEAYEIWVSNQAETVIRLADKEDIAALQQLYYELEQDAVRFQPEHFVHGNRDALFFEGIFQSDTQDIIVAEQNGKIVGFAHVMILEQKRVPCLKPERVIYLQDLDVSEELRSQGIGTRLIEACKVYGKEREADFMRTQVFPQNTRGMKFYEKAGFSEKMKTIETYL
ncbi:MAG: GNAT family N-acetyltransferase [Lachnospiraceae bacterium]|nr:GNAT family N-acetyltransferase [Lachnospiraceae bacterium]